ncbi:MAG: hypothetical protein ACIWVG_19705, partial [Gloeotrichia echinulata HAB0833]
VTKTTTFVTKTTTFVTKITTFVTKITTFVTKTTTFVTKTSSNTVQLEPKTLTHVGWVEALRTPSENPQGNPTFGGFVGLAYGKQATFLNPTYDFPKPTQYWSKSWICYNSKC